jgi:3'-phosphoadenosine 5'-phosphosulfate sulfotransferase (PAPS reductase)/FAD synthetase
VSKIVKLQEELIKIVEEAKDPILSLSFGKDSLLLLDTLQSIGKKLPVLVFPHFWSKHQLQFVKTVMSDYKLQAFFYRASKLNFDGQTIHAYYNLGNTEIPVLYDVIHSDKVCGLDIGNKAVKGVVPVFLWDRVIVGTKKSDTHQAVNFFDFSTLDNISTPLWNWTDNEVLDQTKMIYDKRVYELNDETADTGNFVGCMKCFGVEKVFCPKLCQVIKGVN